MQQIFQGTLFNSPINNWEVSAVTSMSNMFRNTPFNQTLDNWDTSSVTDMLGMFSFAESFDQNIGNWDISNVTLMTDMFNGVTLSQENYDATLIGWHTDTSGVANDGIDDVPNNITFHGGSSQYCSAIFARNSLDTSFNWSITDGGLGCRAEDYFITTWVVEENETITIPTAGIGYSYDVDWSYDGVTFNPESTNVSGNATSTTLTAGTYTVAIRGVFPRIYFNNTGDKDKIQTIEQWGTNIWTSMEQSFWGCRNLVLNATGIPNLSQVTSMFDMFRNCNSFVDNGGAINNWDVSKITNMKRVFQGTLFNSPINNWEVSAVTTMSNMFENTPFNQPLDNWDTSSVNDFFNMFKKNGSFNQNISSWNTELVTTMESMFNSATSFNQDISSWDISNVIAMDDMFLGATLSQENYDATLIGWHTDT
ncbi:BspA family leucine-rich repeat surface protein, partial [Gaetbulibacter sp. 2012CJ34-3]|nr:BspA family leucine-rich repeat surface protein [Jejuia spongiicola]